MGSGSGGGSCDSGCTTHRLGALGEGLQREADVFEGLVLRGGGDDIGQGGDGEEGEGRGGLQRLAQQAERRRRHSARHQAVHQNDEQAVPEPLLLGAEPHGHQALLDERVDQETSGDGGEEAANSQVVGQPVRLRHGAHRSLCTTAGVAAAADGTAEPGTEATAACLSRLPQTTSGSYA